MRTRLALASAVVALGLMAAGCGDDDDSADEATTTSAPATTAAVATTAEPAPTTTAAATTTTAAATTTTAPQVADDVAAILNQSDLAQLSMAVTTAGLRAALKEPGPFTIFAPNNDAFAALGIAKINELNQNPQAWVPILTYHVVPGKLTAEDLVTGKLTTLGGAELDVVVENGKVTVNGVEVIEADRMAENGVVHVLGSVLTPPA